MDSSVYTISLSCAGDYEHGLLRKKRLNEFFLIENIPNFVETGTFRGDGTNWATQQPNFTKILSTEIFKDLYNDCLNRFILHTNTVKLYNLDTIVFLNEVITDIKTPTLFYLDAHGGCEQFGKNDDHLVPLVKEITIILEKFYNLDNVLIVIDDERLFENEKPNDWDVNDFYTIQKMCKDRELVDIYLDDSIIFCKPNWLRNNS